LAQRSKNALNLEPGRAQEIVVHRANGFRHGLAAAQSTVERGERPGVPAIAFPAASGLTLVWATDDGLFQVLPETKAHATVLTTHPVRRFDSEGKRKTSIEYYRGIVGAAYLHALRRGKAPAEARSDVDEFLLILKREILDRETCKRIDNNPDWEETFCRQTIAPDPFLKAVEAGLANHVELLREWPGICVALQKLVAGKTVMRFS
jgi:hypothetical protein